ncbi:MAG: FtsX-like permease family protein [Acidimicrobiales bacterium]
MFTTDQYKTQTIFRADAAATGPHSPAPPGITRLPGPGQYYASPALSALMRAAPASELRHRFPGTQIGVIGQAGLPSPGDLIVIVGHTPAQLSGVLGAVKVASIETAPGAVLSATVQSGSSVSYNASDIEVVLAIGALALLLPVLIFIGTATRLSAARREQRFAAMRLVGATPKQISVIAAVESALASVGGVAVGFLLFYLLHPVLDHVSVTGQPFWPNDVSLNVIEVGIVVLGVPVAALFAGRLALRRVRISPLGVTLRVTPPSPRPYRVAPLVAGLVVLTYFATFGKPKSVGGQIDGYVLGFVLLMVGLIIAGPWLTMIGARRMAQGTNRPDFLLAGRRLSDNPRSGFRAVSGLILALFITTVTVAITGTILTAHSTPTGTTTVRNTLVDQLGDGQTSGVKSISLPAIPPRLVPELRAIPGVRGVSVIHMVPDYQMPGGIWPGEIPGLVSCSQLQGTPTLGRCASGATVATLHPNFGFSIKSTTQVGTTWPAADVPASQLAQLPVQSIVVYTTDSSSAIEQARTDLDSALPYEGPPTLLGGISGENTQIFEALRRMADLLIGTSLIIAGCSLAVSVTGGISERRRPFSLLRLTGVPVTILRRVVALEAGVPLVTLAFLSVGLGLLASDLFLRSQLSLSLHPPGAAYYTVVLVGILVSLAIIGATLPIIERITGPEVARSE